MTILAVTNIKGGVGKTTTAVNLAWLSARDGTPTLLWDLDPQGAASYTLRIRPELPVGCARLLRDEDALSESIKGSDFAGLDLLPADFSYRKLDALLARSDRRGHGLQRALDPLRPAYARILLDCPPGISFLAESVFSCADALVVPTPPTVLSLRTVARLARHVAARRDRCPLLLAFLNMADRRTALHRTVADRMLLHARAGAADGPGAWLAAAIPLAGVVEQMGVQRAPLGAFAPRSAAAHELERLWAEVLAALARPADDGARRRACLRLADGIDLALRGIERDGCDAPPAKPDEAVPTLAPPAPPRGRAALHAVELRLALPADTDTSALLQGGDGDEAPPAGVPQLVHHFDTPDEALRGADFRLRLREERGRYVLGVAGPGERLGACDARPVEQVGIDAAWALGVLSGRRSPAEVLRQRLARAASPLLEQVEALIGAGVVTRTSSQRCVRHGVGVLPAPESAPVALDRAELPGGDVEQSLVVMVAPGSAAACAAALPQVLERAGAASAPDAP